MTLARLLVASTLAVALGSPVSAEPRHRKLDKTLRQSVERGCVGTKRVIIRTKPGYREAVRKSLTNGGRKVKGEFPALDAITAEVRCEDLLNLADSNSTSSISGVHKLTAQQFDLAVEEPAPATDSWLTIDDSAIDDARLQEAYAAQQLQTNFFATLAVRQPVSWTTWSFGGFYTTANYSTADYSTADYSTGYVAGQAPSIGIAIIDSGIQSGVDFDSRITAFYDFTYGDIRSSAPSDEYGHGTHVAGLAAGTYVGVAPGARLIGLKVLDANGQGTSDNVIRAIEFAVANKDLLGINILNLSLGHPIFESAATDPMVQAVEHASRAGLVVVLSAGNFGTNPTTGQVGYAGVASPGNAPSGISVGSVRTFDTVSREDDRIAPYSSRGPSWYDGYVKPDISAPGDNVLSVAAVGSKLRLAQEKRGNVGNYMRLKGTSMAAGVVSGLAALVLEANAGLTPNALKMVLQYSSIPVNDDDGYADVLTQGAGAINAEGALTLARAIDPTVAVGEKWLTTAFEPTSVIGGQSYLWAQRMVWGNHIARGTGVIDEQRPSWALNIVWGDGLEDDDNIVWGNSSDDDNIVWGNALDDDDNIVWGNAGLLGDVIKAPRKNGHQKAKNAIK
jgi:serine protease AprX